MGKENRCSSTECRTFRRRSRGCIYRGDLCNRCDSKSTVHADRQQQTGNNEDHTADHNIFRQHRKQSTATAISEMHCISEEQGTKMALLLEIMYSGNSDLKCRYLHLHFLLWESCADSLFFLPRYIKRSTMELF